MRIGELARRAGVSTKAVRYYEALGLVSPARLANGYRDFGEHDVRAIREVRALSELGIAAERTRPFLDCLAAGRAHPDDCPSSLASYRDAIDDLSTRIEELSARRTALLARLRDAACRGRAGVVPSAGRAGAGHDSWRLPAGVRAPEDDGAADHLPGQRVPRITLPCTSGDRVSLHDLGPGRSVIYLYPLTGRPDIDLPEGWDAIPGARGCTAEACGFRDHYGELTAVGAARVFGLSSQETPYQAELASRLGLPFAMLSDPGLRLAAAVGLPVFEFAGLTLFRRLTLIIRDDGIEHVFYPVFPPGQHAGQVLAWLENSRDR